MDRQQTHNPIEAMLYAGSSCLQDRLGAVGRVGGIAAALLLSACASQGLIQDGAPSNPPDLSQMPDATPRVEPLSPYGNPATYVVNGKRYHTLKSRTGYDERGIASWYGTKFHGQRTSSGEPYDMYKMTAAHKTLPLPTYAAVKNLENGREVVVRINDRGPFHPNRIIDLSYAAATRLGITGHGTARVEVRAIEPRSTDKAQPVKTASAAERVYVQVGAFTQRVNAQRLKSRLEGAAIDHKVHILAAGKQRLFRVRIGPLTGAEVARNMTEKLSRLGIVDSAIIIE